MSDAFAILLQSIQIGKQERAVQKTEAIIGGGFKAWDELLSLAELHLVTPQVEILLSKLPAEFVPETASQKLKETNRENTLRQLRHLSEYIAVKEILDCNYMQVVPFKGFTLAHGYYDDISHRISGDVDLFFDYRDFDRVFKLMTENGYRPETGFSEILIKKIKKQSAELNFERYENDRKIAHLEFHWRMGSSSHGMDISFDDLRQHIRMSEIGGVVTPVFSPSATFLLTVMHHGGKDPFFQLKHILDIGRIINKNKDLDWAWILSMARRYDIEKIVFVAVGLAVELTGVLPPEEITSQMHSRDVMSLIRNRMHYLSTSRGPDQRRSYEFNRIIFQLRSRTGVRARFSLLALYVKTTVFAMLVPDFIKRLYLIKRYDIRN